MRELTPGTVIGLKYIVRERLGEGGMGAVYRADEPILARSVAIKVLKPELASDAALVRRLRNEAVAASRVQHPGSIAVVESGALANGAPYIVMQHLRGRPLGRLLAEEQVPLARVLDLALQITSALDAVHAAGVIHADVKSDNLLVEPLDGRDHVTLIDFGLARFVGDGACSSDDVVSGTPEYMAPEVAVGNAPTVSSDIYSVGVILYELLTGRTPFGGGTPIEIVRRQVEDLAVLPSLRCPARDIPRELDAIVIRALSKRPQDRFRDMHELTCALRSVQIRGRAHPRRAWLPVEHTPAESPTRNCHVPHRIARGSDPGLARYAELRRAIGESMIRGDIWQIAEGYVQLASALATDRNLDAALAELREGIDVLAGAGTAGSAARLTAALLDLANRSPTLADLSSAMSAGGR